MDKIRAIIDGKEVVGWYVYRCQTKLSGEVVWKHTVYVAHSEGFTDCIEIPDISTCAVATGRKDKHGVEIFGSKGEMQGGDRIRGCTTGEHRDVSWDEQQLTWVATTQYGNHAKVGPLANYDTTGHEIIPKSEGGA